MAPQGGIAVLGVPGASGLAAASVVGQGPGGTTVATVPAQLATPPNGSVGCPVNPPTTPTTPGTTPGTTTTVAPGAPVPGPNQTDPVRSGTSTGG
jgi:hypothetical protein